MKPIRIAIVGVGNCCSSLVQGINYYRGVSDEMAVGLMHSEIGGYRPHDIEVAAAFDIDERKVGKELSEAIFQPPNCTKVFCDAVKTNGTKVSMGRVLDGCSAHMQDFDEKYRFVVSKRRQPEKRDVISALQESGAEILLNYLPVGSEQAARFYAECALEAGVALINNMPVFIASDQEWASRFEKSNLPLIGDDVKSQIGATIIHRALVNLFRKRGAKLERTYQINTGGNTDFLNMLNRQRLLSKKKSKVEAVQAVASERLSDENIHVGPSDWVAWQKDNKVCFIRIEGSLFGGVPMNIELRLSVEDSPNSAGIVIDAIRCSKLALLRGIGGVLYGPAAYFMKHPPLQFSDDDACRMTEAFIEGAVTDEADRSFGYGAKPSSAGNPDGVPCSVGGATEESVIASLRIKSGR